MMAVLCEGISVIIRRDAIDNRYYGGWRNFVTNFSNSTMCSDGQLVRLGFMAPTDVEECIGKLDKAGLSFDKNGKAVDVTVVDQKTGPTVTTDWIEFAHLPYGNYGNVSACWLWLGKKLPGGINFPSDEIDIETPEGWIYETSLSASNSYALSENYNMNLQFIRHENGMDVYFDNTTMKECYIARTIKPADPHAKKTNFLSTILKSMGWD